MPRLNVLGAFPAGWRTPVVLLLGLDLASRLYFALRPLLLNDNKFIPDDAYLSLHIARSIAAGAGPLYGGEFTNGFQPLYVFLMTPFFLLMKGDLFGPVRAALVLLSVFDVATLFFCLRLLAGAGLSLGAVVFAGVAWILNPHFIASTMNGLETGVAAVFIVASLDWFYRHFQAAGRPTPTARSSVVLGILLGLAVLARIDSVFLVVAIVLVLLVQGLRARRPMAPVLLSLAFVGLGAVVTYAPWAIYSLAYTGDLYPVSGKAVRFMSLANVNHAPTWSTWYGPMMVRGLWILSSRNLSLWIGTGVVALGLIVLAKRASQDRRVTHAHLLVAPALFAASLYLAYTLYIFTPWFMGRYFHPISIFFLLVLAVLADALFAAGRSASQRKIVAAIAILAMVIVDFPALKRIVSPDTGSSGYMSLGLWARDALPAGTVIGGSQTGGLGYFADNLRVVNLDGVVSKSCYQSLVERRNWDYIRSKNIEYIVGWQSNLKFIAEHSTGFPNELQIGLIEELRAWSTPWYLMRVAPEPAPSTTP